jgi:hypothetical protein
LFSNAGGIRPDQDAPPMMIVMDDPGRLLRRMLVNAGFTRKRVKDRESSIATLCDSTPLRALRVRTVHGDGVLHEVIRLGRRQSQPGQPALKRIHGGGEGTLHDAKLRHHTAIVTEDVVVAALMRNADQLLRVIGGNPIPGQEAEELVIRTIGVRGRCCKQCRGDGGKKATRKTNDHG